MITVPFVIMDEDTLEYMTRSSGHWGLFNKDLQLAQLYKDEKYTRTYIKLWAVADRIHPVRRLIAIPVRIVIN